ncbi:aspartate/glutamate racemase family protein [Roseovarius atlanticus]|uniref:aspartate/glutamate racemase family protein n=1 Tax=Roseovarius atlanticus TaxID=1641875 RepID=UPI001C971F7E|nr:aspartate/glutamate racemase family protein [Roseovarius atlanticus]MBY5988807.1 aspartate/glutamate racemase family protein [Roseovarius atlanticus]MBY6124198.1 aspartate/glutamate racemase family protein [Roseovarius atlanticus]MBY6148693.1 aspartate/glutamate racemase family protein [Roseovarius atlanticus]
MKIAVINPNATVSMTDKIAATARSVCAPGVEIEARTGIGAPVSIEGHYDEAMAMPKLLDQVREAEAGNADAIVVACFDDPGLGACREIATGPVVGLCEAAVKAASMIATSFSVITTLPRSAPIIEELVRRYGLDHQCRKVRSAAIPVLALEEPGSNARIQVRDEILRAIEEDRCEAVVLGCAGMSDLVEWLSEETGIPVIDGVSVATKFAEALVGAGLKTSKIGAYATPNPK